MYPQCQSRLSKPLKNLVRLGMSCLEEEMKAAGQEERCLALERKGFLEGVPAITVVLDGSWSKRSHKHSYNAKSRVAVIIGKATKCLLHLEVRNNFYSVCSHAQSCQSSQWHTHTTRTGTPHLPPWSQMSS